MKEQEILAERIKDLCKEKGISFYTLSYRASIPLSTLIHIIDGSTQNPGIFTVSKICSGLNITLKDFFNSEKFDNIEYEVE